MPVGFYYKSMIRPRWLWPVYESVIRRIAGLGEVDIETVPEHDYRKEYRHSDVMVIGGGPAGISAALQAARAGAEVVLVDDQTSIGGHLRFGRTEDSARALAAELATEPNIETFLNATAFGFYEGDLVGVVQGERVIQIRTKRTIIATGMFEHPLIFKNNDLPGVMLGSGVQRMLHLDGVVAGERAVVVTNNDYGLAVAADLLEAGVTIEAVVDAREVFPNHPVTEALQQSGARMLHGHTISEASGGRNVNGAALVQLNADGNTMPGTEQHIACDLIVVSTGFEAAAGLIYQSGGKLKFDPELGRFVPSALPPSVAVAGDVNGTHGADAHKCEGQAAGLQAANDLGFGDEETIGRCDELRCRAAELQEQPKKAPSLITISHKDKKKFVCLCEDLTEKDICDAIEEGYEHIETLKRYSTLSMGPCQGRMCAMASIHLCARQTGRTIDETGTTTSRPPVTPISFGALAGAIEEPVMYTPLHHVHVGLGAEQMGMGQWMRPKVYTSVTDEYRAVRERVGLIDVGTLGKLDIKGKDAERLLDKVYTNRLKTLKPGRVRYGVMCDDSGIIVDDGTVTRLSDDHFFITTTSGNVEFVHEWLEWWTAGTDMDVAVTNVTAGYSAVNLAGPRSREVLATVTDMDLSTKAFPYMDAPEGEIAGIPALMLRIGFVGELGYEIHTPAAHGPALWNALMEAGRPNGIAPFGVDTQRLLRLEKKHIIVGQDTDALSNPLEADMSWVVHFRKKDFIGKAALMRVKERGLKNKLVGIMVDEDAEVVDGNSIVANGNSVGRVTSFRYSPGVGRGIGMAWVPSGLAEEGQPLTIHLDHGYASAHVYNKPFYDPEGERLRA